MLLWLLITLLLAFFHNRHVPCSLKVSTTLTAHNYPPEDAHGAGHYYHFVIIRKSSEPFRLLLGYLQPMANYWRKTYQHLDYDIPLNKYPMRSSRRSKQGKVICPGSQHVGRSGAQTHNLPFTVRLNKLQQNKHIQ